MISSITITTLGQYRLAFVGQCDSTNKLAAEFAFEGDPGNLWVVAEKQNAGRGSRGRDWSSLEGNLFASLLLREPSEPKYFSQLTFVTSLAMRDAILNIGGKDLDVGLKWPNDVLISGEKCSGILLEGGKHSGGDYLIIGIGVNCLHAPSRMDKTVTCLSSHGIMCEPMGFLNVLADAISEQIRVWNRGDGFHLIRSRWLENAVGIGKEVSVSIPGQKISHGTFASVDEAGYMLLQTGGGSLERISAADVFF